MSFFVLSRANARAASISTFPSSLLTMTVYLRAEGHARRGPHAHPGRHAIRVRLGLPISGSVRHAIGHPLRDVGDVTRTTSAGALPRVSLRPGPPHLSPLDRTSRSASTSPLRSAARD